MNALANFVGTRAELDSARCSIEKILGYPLPPDEVPWGSPALWNLLPSRWDSLIGAINNMELNRSTESVH